MRERVGSSASAAGVPLSRGGAAAAEHKLHELPAQHKCTLGLLVISIPRVIYVSVFENSPTSKGTGAPLIHMKYEFRHEKQPFDDVAL